SCRLSFPTRRSSDLLVGDDGGFWVEADELGDFRAHENEFPAGGKVRSHRRENVAAMESGRDWRLNHPVGVGDFAGGFEAVTVDDWSDEAVIWKNEVLAFLGFGDDGFA